MFFLYSKGNARGMFFLLYGVFFFSIACGRCVFGVEDFPSLMVKKKALPGISVQAHGAILMNLQTGVVLYEKDADTQLYPASLTKVATALFILARKPHVLGEEAVVSKEAVRVAPASVRQKNIPGVGSHCLEHDGISLGLVAGERASCLCLLEGMLIFSANDAANVLAEHCSGSIPLFMQELEAFLKEELSDVQASFHNPHGLHDPAQIASARALALITQRAMQYPLFREIVGKPGCTVSTSVGGERFLEAKNKLLLPRKKKFYYPSATGVKTGYTLRSKYNLIATAVEGTRELLFVLLGCPGPSHFEQARQTFTLAFQEKKKTRVLFPAIGTSLYTPETRFFARLPVKVCEDVSVSYYPSEEPDNLSAEIQWGKWPMIHGPKTPLGSLVVFLDGKEISRTSLVSLHGVSWLQALGLLHSQWKLCAFFAVLLLGWVRKRKV